MSDVRFGYTIVYVPEVQTALDFYTRAFGFEQRFVSPDGSYGELDTGTTTLSFASEALGDSHFAHGFLRHSLANPPFGTELAFTTPDVDATVTAALDAGAQLLVAAETKDWGQTVAWVRDPNGVLIEICTPIEG
jgi:catechol 2,3-dioxygenase-like lactoylglutathione lyase family enzyme